LVIVPVRAGTRIWGGSQFDFEASRREGLRYDYRSNGIFEGGTLVNGSVVARRLRPWTSKPDASLFLEVERALVVETFGEQGPDQFLRQQEPNALTGTNFEPFERYPGLGYFLGCVMGYGDEAVSGDALSSKGWLCAGLTEARNSLPRLQEVVTSSPKLVRSLCSDVDSQDPKSVRACLSFSTSTREWSKYGEDRTRILELLGVVDPGGSHGDSAEAVGERVVLSWRKRFDSSAPGSERTLLAAARAALAMRSHVEAASELTTKDRLASEAFEREDLERAKGRDAHSTPTGSCPASGPVQAPREPFVAEAQGNGGTESTWVRDAEGRKWLLKRDSLHTASQTANEIIVSRIYRRLGFLAPDVSLTSWEGHRVAAVAEVPGAREASASEVEKTLDERTRKRRTLAIRFLRDHDRDANPGNTLLVQSKPVFIDFGGALGIRALGEHKTGGRVVSDAIGAYAQERPAIELVNETKAPWHLGDPAETASIVEEFARDLRGCLDDGFLADIVAAAAYPRAEDTSAMTEALRSMRTKIASYLENYAADIRSF
jgi:hypothetical protein